ncbi:MAG: hypothetical protein ABIN08_23935 [Caldimonas sp.]
MVRAFPLCERGKLLWIWMGASDQADPDAIPQQDFMDGEGWVSSTDACTLRPAMFACTRSSRSHSFELSVDGLDAIESLLSNCTERQPEISFHADRASLAMRRSLKRHAW